MNINSDKKWLSHIIVKGAKGAVLSVDTYPICTITSDNYDINFTEILGNIHRLYSDLRILRKKAIDNNRYDVYVNEYQVLERQLTIDIITLSIINQLETDIDDSFPSTPTEPKWFYLNNSRIAIDNLRLTLSSVALDGVSYECIAPE